MVNLQLNQEEANFALAVFGQLPTQTGAFILYQRLKDQMKENDMEVPTTTQEPTTNESEVQPSSEEGSDA